MTPEVNLQDSSFSEVRLTTLLPLLFLFLCSVTFSIVPRPKRDLYAHVLAIILVTNADGLLSELP